MSTENPSENEEVDHHESSHGTKADLDITTTTTAIPGDDQPQQEPPIPSNAECATDKTEEEYKDVSLSPDRQKTPAAPSQDSAAACAELSEPEPDPELVVSVDNKQEKEKDLEAQNNGEDEQKPEETEPSQCEACFVCFCVGCGRFWMAVGALIVWLICTAIIWGSFLALTVCYCVLRSVWYMITECFKSMFENEVESAVRRAVQNAEDEHDGTTWCLDATPWVEAQKSMQTCLHERVFE